MRASWFARCFFVAAIAAGGCNGTTPDDAFNHASTAIDEVEDVRRELRDAIARIDDLESKATDLENADDDLGYRIDDVESRLP